MGKRGRQPRILTDEEIQKCYELGEVGCTIQEISSVLKINHETFKKLLQRQPEAREAIKQGKDNAHENVKRVAYTMAMSGKFPAMTMFYLKTQCRWREKDREDDNKPVEIRLKYDPKKLPETDNTIDAEVKDE